MADLVRALLLRPVPIEIDSEGMIPTALASVVGTLDAVVITSRVQNPTGACVTMSRSVELGSVLDPLPDVLVIEDDHAGLISGNPLAPVGFDRSRWAMAASMSKAIGPDLRVAALFGDQATIDGVRQRQRVGPGWVSHLLQVIAATVMTDVGDWMAEVTAEYDRRRTSLVDALAGVGIETEAPSGLNVWVPVTDTAGTVAACLESGYAIRSGDAFVLDDTRAVRITTSRITVEQAEDVARTIDLVLNSERRHIRTG
jgi:DNA-binding transcriptional MocR family regulator